MPDVTHALLSKLDVATWLVTKHPRLSERSHFIRLIFECLTGSGGHAPLQSLARAHLVNVFRHDFPEHYGEVLEAALMHSGRGALAVPVWRDLLAALVWPGELPHAETVTAQELRQLAANQKMLRQDMLMESTAMLGRYFRYGPFLYYISQ